MGGEWRIRQPPAPNEYTGGGYHTEIVPMGDLTPDDMDFVHGIAFNYKDGRTVIYPWHAIVRAEYVPDPADDQ